MDKTRYEFSEWPLDLLVDYALKVHHRGIRRNGAEIIRLLTKIENDGNSTTREIGELFAASMADLEDHLLKEENVLFPYLYELYEAASAGRPAEQMHCGTIQNPIRVMMMEHESETERHALISRLTGGYAAGDGCSDDYRLLMDKLSAFAEALREHVHIENDIIFPGFEQLEEKWVLM